MILSIQSANSVQIGPSSMFTKCLPNLSSKFAILGSEITTEEVKVLQLCNTYNLILLFLTYSLYDLNNLDAVNCIYNEKINLTTYL